MGISESPRFEGCNVLQVEKHLSIGEMKLNLAEKNVVIHGAEVMLTRKKFVRYKEGAEIYSMGLTKFQELAKPDIVNKLCPSNTGSISTFVSE